MTLVTRSHTPAPTDPVSNWIQERRSVLRYFLCCTVAATHIVPRAAGSLLLQTFSICCCLPSQENADQSISRTTEPTRRGATQCVPHCSAILDSAPAGSRTNLVNAHCWKSFAPHPRSQGEWGPTRLSISAPIRPTPHHLKPGGYCTIAQLQKLNVIGQAGKYWAKSGSSLDTRPSPVETCVAQQGVREQTA